MIWYRDDVKLSNVDGKPINWTFDEFEAVREKVTEAIHLIEDPKDQDTGERLDDIAFQVATKLFRRVRPDEDDF